MASVYVHLSGRDVDDAILKMHGILAKDEEKKEEEIEVKECIFCHEKNSFKTKYCRRCGTSLDPKIAMETITTPEKLDERIKKIVEEMLAQKD
jgi:ribosomal protein L40E